MKHVDAVRKWLSGENAVSANTLFEDNIVRRYKSIVAYKVERVIYLANINKNISTTALLNLIKKEAEKVGFEVYAVSNSQMPRDITFATKSYPVGAIYFKSHRTFDVVHYVAFYTDELDIEFKKLLDDSRYYRVYFELP